MGITDIKEIPFIHCNIEDSGMMTCCLTEEIASLDAVSDYITHPRQAPTHSRTFSVAVSEANISFYRRLCEFVDNLKSQAVLAVPAPDLCTEYFKLIVMLLIVTEGTLNTNAFAPHKRLLEEFYFIGCIRDVYGGRYILPPYHPVLSIHALAAEDGKAQVEKLRGDHNKYEIASAIVLNKARRDKEFLMFSSDEVYQVSQLRQDSEVWVADLFQNARTLVKVESIRLIEKVERYITEHHLSEKLTPVKIAVFGEMADSAGSSSVLGKYIEKNHNIKVNITNFKRVPTVGDYVFIPDDAGSSSEKKNIFNLMDNSDIETLYGSYSLILFLGENYFYRQHQGQKMTKEARVSTRADWYVNVMAEAYPDFKDKAICYSRCFDGVGSWINTYDDALSGALQFDEKLFKRLGSVEHPDSDIYLYIKYGKSIGEYDLFTQNICNDELYDGNSLTVYCYSKHSEDINDDIMNFLNNEFIPQYRVYIDLWKLVKSLGNDYWRTFAVDIGLLETDCDEKAEVDCIHELRQIQFYIDYSQLAKNPDQKVICYGVAYGGEEQTEAIKEKISPYVEAVLQFAFVEREKKIRDKLKANLQKDNGDAIDLPCVHKYLRNLLVNSIISRANNIQDLLFAYLVDMERYTIQQVIEINDDTKRERKPYNNICDFRAAKLIYSIVVKLEQLNLRSLDDPKSYFTNEFRFKISQDITKETMIQIMKRIGDACNDLKYVSNLLYYSETM